MTERNAPPNPSDVPSYGGGNFMGANLQPSFLLFRMAMSLLGILGSGPIKGIPKAGLA